MRTELTTTVNGYETSFLAYHNTENKYADMHAWRHTFVSLLIASGVNAKMAMDLARHSSLDLTLGRYAHVEQAAVVDAMNKMPQFLPATEPNGKRLACALPYPDTKHAPAMITHEKDGNGFSPLDTEPKSLNAKVFTNGCDSMRQGEKEYARRESNPQPMVPKTIALSS